MARLTVETKTFDYKSEKAFLLHACKMQKKGWQVIESHPWSDDGKHKYFCATFKRGVLFNGYDGSGKLNYNSDWH